MHIQPTFEGFGPESLPPRPKHTRHTRDDKTDEFPFAAQRRDDVRPYILPPDQIGGEVESTADIHITKLTDRERIGVVWREAGFIPSSKRETTLALGMIENRESLGGYGRYLNEVLIHQIRSTSPDPKAAIRSILEEVKGYAYGSQVQQSFTSELIQRFADESTSMGSNLRSLQNTGLLQDWKYQGDATRTLEWIVHDRLVTQQLESNDDAPVSIDVETDPLVINEYIRTTRVGEFLGEADELRRRQAVREQFWLEALRQSRSQLVAKPIADSALSQLLNKTRAS